MTNINPQAEVRDFVPTREDLFRLAKAYAEDVVSYEFCEFSHPNDCHDHGPAITHSEKQLKRVEAVLGEQCVKKARLESVLDYGRFIDRATYERFLLGARASEFEEEADEPVSD